MGKVRLLLCAALAALLLAGCIADSSSVGESVSVGMPSPSPSPAPAPSKPLTVTAADGVALIHTLTEAALADQIGDPDASFCYTLTPLSADRLLLPVALANGATAWYLYEPAGDIFTLLARMPENRPQISSAWEEGEQIRVISEAGAFTLDPAAEPLEITGINNDWTLRGNPVTGDLYHRQGGQLIRVAPDGGETVLYVWPDKGALSAAEPSSDGSRLFFGIIPYEGISDVVVLDLATGAAETTPMRAAYPRLCWLGDKPCLITLEEEEGMLFRYGDHLAETFLWQPSDSNGWQNASIAYSGGGRVLLNASYTDPEGNPSSTLSLFCCDETGITERPLVKVTGWISDTALSSDGGTLALCINDGSGGAEQLLLYEIKN